MGVEGLNRRVERAIRIEQNVQETNIGVNVQEQDLQLAYEILL